MQDLNKEWRVFLKFSVLMVDLNFILDETFTEEKSLKFQLTANVHRRPLFYMITVVMPLFLLGTVSGLSITLPAITGDRIALLLSCLLATVIYLETTFKYIPETSTNVPVVVGVIIVILINTVVQIFLAGICLNWANKEERKKKPGKRFAFFVFIVIFIIPYIFYIIKKCFNHLRRKKVVSLEETSTGQPDNRTEDEPNQEQQKMDEDKKSYHTAIKIVDRLAIILGLISLMALSFIGYLIIRSNSILLQKFCEISLGDSFH